MMFSNEIKNINEIRQDWDTKIFPGSFFFVSEASFTFTARHLKIVPVGSQNGDKPGPLIPKTKMGE